MGIVKNKGLAENTHKQNTKLYSVGKNNNKEVDPVII